MNTSGYKTQDTNAVATLGIFGSANFVSGHSTNAPSIDQIKTPINLISGNSELPTRSVSNSTSSDGNTDHTDKEQDSDYDIDLSTGDPLAASRKESSDGREVSYVTWEEITTNQYEGINYLDNHDKILQEYKKGYEKKELHIKPKKSKKVSSSLYDSAVGAAKSFLDNNLSDLVSGLKGNQHLTKVQKDHVLDMVHNLGIHYQLEIGAYIKACTDNDKFDTLFYQKSVGPIIREIVKTSSNRKFQIRERSRNAMTFESGASPRNSPSDLIENDFSKEKSIKISPLKYAMRLAGVKQGLDMALDGYLDEHNSAHNSPYNNDFKGLKVVATISVASTYAPAKDYNTPDGLKSLVEGIDPNLNSLSLVRVDTAHTWTELQCHLLKEAAECNDFSLFMKNTAQELFLTEQQGEQITVTKDECGLVRVKKESSLWIAKKESMKKSGVKWHDDHFRNVYKILTENHFKDESSYGFGFNIKDQSDPEDNDWINYKYESALSKQSKRLYQIRESKAKVMGVLTHLINQANTNRTPDDVESDVTSIEDRLNSISLAIALLENVGFMEHFIKSCAEEGIDFNSRHAELYCQDACKLFREELEKHSKEMEPLISHVKLLTEAPVPDEIGKNTEGHCSRDVLMEIVYKNSVLPEILKDKQTSPDDVDLDISSMSRFFSNHDKPKGSSPSRGGDYPATMRKAMSGEGLVQSEFTSEFPIVNNGR